jgi:hypothetical protein
MQDFTPFKINFEQFTTAGNKTPNYRFQKSAYSTLKHAFPLQRIAILHPKRMGYLIKYQVYKIRNFKIIIKTTAGSNDELHSN